MTAWIADGALVAPGVRLGSHVVVHRGTIIEAGATVEDGAVLGTTPTLGARSSASAAPRPPLVVEAGAHIGTLAVVFAGARIGAGAVVGDHANVREGAVVGADAVVEWGCALGTDVTIGARARLRAGAWLTSWTVVEEDVFVGPNVMTMNDDTMARLAPGAALRGPVLRRACRVGGGVRLTPGVDVGEEAFVGAGSVVTNDVPARARVMGIPARIVGRVGDDELLTPP